MKLQIVESNENNSYFFRQEMAGSLLIFNGKQNKIFHLVSDHNFKEGDTLNILQKGSGRISFVGGEGQKILSTDSSNKTRTKNSVVALTYLGESEWLLTGDISK